MVLDVFDRTIEHGNAALTVSATGGEALRRYLHAAIDNGLGVVNIVNEMLDSVDWADRRAAASELLDRLVAAARRDGAIREDVGPIDIPFAAIRFCRPLGIGLNPSEERSIAHRQLNTFLDGLMPRRG